MARRLAVPALPVAVAPHADGEPAAPAAPRLEHEAIAAARARPETEAGRRLYGQRRGIEGTISRAVRVFDPRRARHRGLAKTVLQHVAPAAALNPDRLGAWFAERPLAPTRTSRFAALAA